MMQRSRIFRPSVLNTPCERLHRYVCRTMLAWELIAIRQQGIATGLQNDIHDKLIQIGAQLECN